jgi:hypothetical protein
MYLISLKFFSLGIGEGGREKFLFRKLFPDYDRSERKSAINNRI